MSTNTTETPKTRSFYLNDLLEMGYTTREKKLTTLDDVYGVIYRIHCIPENKNYIGQTYSHKISGQYLARAGILSRAKDHYNTQREDPICKGRPLYVALNTYEPSEFIVYEEKRIYGRDIQKHRH